METSLGRALEDTANDPDPPAEDNGPLATEVVGEPGDGESAGEGAGGHGGDDGALGVGVGVAEVVLVGVIGEDAGHGRDVQTEETATDTCERPDNILWKCNSRQITWYSAGVIT